MAFKKNKEFKAPGSGLARLSEFLAPRGARFVLYIGDEGAILVHVKNRAVLHRQFVPDAGEQNLQELRDSLSDDPKAPLLMVLDTMDQSYIQQTLPPVSAFSVKKLIKRRLERDFGPNDLKGAVIIGREKTGRKDWNFLMVGIERSKAITAWIDFVATLKNPFQGIYLSSVETEVVLKSLEHAMGVPKDGTGSEWKFFVSHNKVGGFRQVILHNGRIIFTRLAQPIADSKPEVIAGSIEQEMLSTMEYMRRLAYTPQAGLDIYIIASNTIKAAIDKTKFNADVTHLMTPYEVAQYLKIEGATQPTDQFGDVILAAAIGASRHHVLKLITSETQKIDWLYQLRLYQRLGAGVAALGIFGYMISSGIDIYSAYSRLSELEDKKLAQQRVLNTLRDDITKSHLDIEKTNDMIDLYKQMQQDQLLPLPIIAAIGQVVHPPVKLTALEWAFDTKGGTAAAPGAPGSEQPKIMINLTLQFTDITTRADFKTASKKLLDDTKAAFKDYEVSYTKLPPGLAESDKMEVSLNDSPVTLNSFSDIVLTIKGDAYPASGAAAASGTPATPPQHKSP